MSSYARGNQREKGDGRGDDQASDDDAFEPTLFGNAVPDRPGQNHADNLEEQIIPDFRPREPEALLGQGCHQKRISFRLLKDARTWLMS